MKININIELEVPRVPNYIIIKDNLVRPASSERPKIDIRDLTPVQRKKVIDAWASEFNRKANAKPLDI